MTEPTNPPSTPGPAPELVTAVRIFCDLFEDDTNSISDDTLLEQVEKLRELVAQPGTPKPKCPKCKGVAVEMYWCVDGYQIAYCGNHKCKYKADPAEFFAPTGETK